LVAHIGGELSGTVDEPLRHAVSKLSQCAFCCKMKKQNCLRQMGSEQKTPVIGSPDYGCNAQW